MAEQNGRFDQLKQMKFDEEMAKHFSKAKHNEAFSQLAFDYLKKHFSEQMKDVLEVGIGTGAVGLKIAGVLADSLHGIDPSAAMLSECQELIDHFGLKNVTLQQGNLEKPEDLEKKYDFVFMTNVLHHVEQPLDLVELICQHFLKPSGVFVIIDFHPLSPKDIGIEKDDKETDFSEEYFRMSADAILKTAVRCGCEAARGCDLIEEMNMQQFKEELGQSGHTVGEGTNESCNHRHEHHEGHHHNHHHHGHNFPPKLKIYAISMQKL
eukprot:GCRY01000839.1.p1 GENE.GCRY01000839.1~~GCRY01000839.1.p1  ORF type:complete len:266 (+),score=54.92 GCRY01000839.1:134-931(+)